jgi:hypothetical protein
MNARIEPADWVFARLTATTIPPAVVLFYEYRFGFDDLPHKQWV